MHVYKNISRYILIYPYALNNTTSKYNKTAGEINKSKFIDIYFQTSL